MNKKICKIFIAVLLITLFTCSAITAQANETVDMLRDDCSLTIEMKYVGMPISGGTITIYRVGDIVEDHGDYDFKWKDELNCMVGVDRLESKETTAKVLECVKASNLVGITVSVDGNGEATINNLEVGLYLIEQKIAAGGYTAINPFLVSLPRWEDGHYIYSVTATAKAEIYVDTPDNPTDDEIDDPTDDPTDNSSKPPKTHLPQTGQLNWPVPLLAVFGVAFLGAGFILRRRKNDA